MNSKYNNNKYNNIKIGILALQGAFESHKKILNKFGIQSVFIKRKKDISPDIKGLILPGGESTTNIKLLFQEGLVEEIRKLYKKGIGFFGTCAGVILLANKIDIEQFSFKFLDIEVIRNAYGSQKESFSEDIYFPFIGEPNFHCIFIRAPKIKSVGKKVEVLGTFQNFPILVKQNNILGATFHPELTNDIRIHKYFIDKIVLNSKNKI